MTDFRIKNTIQEPCSQDSGRDAQHKWLMTNYALVWKAGILKSGHLKLKNFTIKQCQQEKQPQICVTESIK